MIIEAENYFIEKIRCKFPYLNKEACLKLIDEALALSTNAVFSVVEEICRIPASDRKKVSTNFLLELLALIAGKFNHPLKDMMLKVAENMIHEKEQSVEEVISKMEIVKKYPGEYSALSILYFSCDDKEQLLEPVWENILKEWNDK